MSPRRKYIASSCLGIVTALLFAACWISANRECALCFRSGHSIALSQGVLALHSSGSPYTDEPRTWWFESGEFVRPLFTSDLVPMRWRTGGGRFNPDGWYFQLSLWQPLLIGIAASSLLVGLMRPGRRAARYKLRIRIINFSFALTLIALCGQWRAGEQIAVSSKMTVAFPSGGVTIASLSLGTWASSSGSVSFLPRYLGPRDLESALGEFILELPLWHLALIATGAAGWMHGTALGARRRTGCAHCGYSTEGRAAETPCPECGTLTKA